MWMWARHLLSFCFVRSKPERRRQQACVKGNAVIRESFEIGTRNVRSQMSWPQCHFCAETSGCDDIAQMTAEGPIVGGNQPESSDG
jgi:hypothetical protein